MTTEAKGAVASVYNRSVIPLALGLIGYAINCLPVEIFSGIHFIFGSVITIAAAVKFGPSAGAVAGALAGIRASTLWGQPFFFGPVLYGLEGLFVGYQTRGGKRGVVAATLAYWVLLGGWLALAGVHFAGGLPIRLALILQARSVINGMMTGLLVKVVLIGVESGWNRRRKLLLEASVAKGELEATFNAMTDAVLITDRADRVLQANLACEQILGIDREKSMGAVLADIVHQNQDWQVCEICTARREGQHGVFFRMPEETRLGKYLEIHVDPVFDPAGERIGSVHVVRDLTAMRRVEAEAERLNALLRDLVNAAYEAVYAARLDGQFLWANKRAADLFGLENESGEGEAFSKSIAASDLEVARSAFDLAARGEAQSFEAQLLGRDEKPRNVLVTNSPIYIDGKVAAVLGIMRDVTEERLTAERLMHTDKLRALGQLAWGVAHNFNNSLTAVLGYTQLVLNKTSDPAIQRNLKTVEKAALDAAQMVQRIQNFARQGKYDKAEPVDLNQTIRDALDLTRSLWKDDAQAAGITCEVIFRPTDCAVGLCDQSAIREVFVNIIINAIEAMPSGGRLTITTLADGDQMVITFADTGSGMSDETRRRIFEPFYTTKGAKGQGMGLAVTYGTIERLGGEIGVTSEAGHGSTFTIRLKRAPATANTPVETSGETTTRSSSVLVVDDEAPIRVLLSDILRARGHKVLTAEDGLAGLKAIENGRFDMVITDLAMPGADGWTLVSETRRRWPKTKLVIVTGYGGFAGLAMPGGESSDVDALISKPFNIAEIDSTIGRLLRDDY